MILSRQDPETPAVYDARKREFDRLWLNGQIGEATYLRSLFVIGYLPRDAQIELNHLKMDREQMRKRR